MQIELTARTERIKGYDIARAFAILGMIVVNYKFVMGASDFGEDSLLLLTGFLEGRAAAAFIILAGVGISLFTNHARYSVDLKPLHERKIILCKRAVLLFFIGLAYTPFWPADILHFYGIYILIGVLAIPLSKRRTMALAGGFVIGFVMLLLLEFDYAGDWKDGNLKSLEYINFWSAKGMIKHLFYNGFHPVFPWVAFLLIGMWLGRLDVRNEIIRSRVIIGAGLIAITAGLASQFYTTLFKDKPIVIDNSTIEWILHTHPMPPMPLFVLSAGGTVTVIILFCVWLAEKFKDAAWVNPLARTGRMSLTIYVSHVILGMGILESIDYLAPHQIEFVILYAFAFFIVSVVFSHFWLAYFKHGPLEWLVRKITHPSSLKKEP